MKTTHTILLWVIFISLAALIVVGGLYIKNIEDRNEIMYSHINQLYFRADILRNTQQRIQNALTPDREYLYINNPSLENADD